MKPVRLLCYLFLWTWRCTTLSNVRIILILRGSLSNDDGDVNENGTKTIGLDWQNNNFARASRFLVHFFAVTARLRCENALISRFVEDVNTRQRLSFSFPELWYSLLELNSRKNANIWRIERDGISAIRFEAVRRHFFSGVFVAVAVVAA